MAKILTVGELVDIVSRAPDEIDDVDQFQDFIRDIAEVVTKHFGGDLGSVGDSLDDGLGCTIGIHINEDVPPDGGVYRKYDTDVEWIEGIERETEKKLTKKQIKQELKNRKEAHDAIFKRKK